MARRRLILGRHGLVYVFWTEPWAGMSKIGESFLSPSEKSEQLIMRFRDDAHDRARKDPSLLSRPGRVYWYLWTSPSEDRKRDEKAIQAILKPHLVPRKQDFFMVSVDVAKAAVQAVTGIMPVPAWGPPKQDANQT